LLLDEMDNARLNENDELRAILNSGHERANAWTVRNVGERHEPRRFATWAPVAFACIGGLPDTVASRCVKVAMRRRAPGERVERLRSSRLARELEPLRPRLARWGKDHAEAIRSADPQLPEALEDREADNWGPLLAIADEIGGAWPMRARSVAAAAPGVSDEAPSVMLLADLRELFAERGTDRLASEEATAALVKLDGRPWPEWRDGRALTARGLARLLKPFGIEPRTVKWPGGVTAKGYHREWFDDAFARYLPPHPSPTSPAANGAGQSTFSQASPSRVVTDERTGFGPHERYVVTQVTDANPEQGGGGVRVDPIDIAFEGQPGRQRTAEGELLDRLAAHGWEPLGGRDA
jgi:putative DNA primase/helicase